MKGLCFVELITVPRFKRKDVCLDNVVLCFTEFIVCQFLVYLMMLYLLVWSVADTILNSFYFN
jgi:hypothetical protein